MTAWLTSLGAWAFGALGYGAIAAIVGLAVLVHFFSRSVSLLAWVIAVAALALSSVGKDAVIASARADLKLEQADRRQERSDAERVANQAAADHRARMRAAEHTAATRIQAAQAAVKEAHAALALATDDLARCRLSDAAVRVLNAAARGPGAD